MAFEPLQTDEKLDVPEQTAQDMDKQMLFGCSGFLISSVVGYLLTIWPFIAFQKTEQTFWLRRRRRSGHHRWSNFYAPLRTRRSVRIRGGCDDHGDLPVPSHSAELSLCASKEQPNSGVSQLVHLAASHRLDPPLRLPRGDRVAKGRDQLAKPRYIDLGMLTFEQQEALSGARSRLDAIRGHL